MKKIAFIGVGIMGRSMAANLMKAGFELHLYVRRKEQAEPLVEAGAFFYDSIAACVAQSEAVITMLGFPSDVEEVYFAKGNILDSAKPGQYLIDMTTTSPELAERIGREGEALGLNVLDAPVTGGDIGAQQGTLAILVGGRREDFDACLPLFEAMGNNIVYQGPAGSGQHCKMANQIMIAGTLSGVCEALAYAQEKGLDVTTVLNAVKTGAAGSRQLDNLGPKIIARDFAPGFFMKHFVKDMGIAQAEALKSGLNLEVLNQALNHCRELEAQGYGDLGTQALIKHYLPQDKVE